MALKDPTAGRQKLETLLSLALVVCGALAARSGAASEIIGALAPGSMPAEKDHARPLIYHKRSDRVRPVEHAKAPACNGRCGKGGCGQPGCPAYCPVRPDEFGFYGTQWRTWPGTGAVKQVGYGAEATPVSPPRSEVPLAEEESPVAIVEPSAPEPPAEPQEEAPKAEPLPPAKPAAEDSLPPNAPVEPPAKEPPAKEQAAPAENNLDNLFDEATLRRRQHERLVAMQQAAVLRERARHEALLQQAAVRSWPPRPVPIHPLREAPALGVIKASHEQPAVGSNPLR